MIWVLTVRELVLEVKLISQALLQDLSCPWDETHESDLRLAM